MLDA
jgi:hypothetical protein